MKDFGIVFIIILGAMFFMTACVPNQILLVTHLSPARKFALWRILTNFCHVKIVTILLDDIIMNHINVYLPLADHEAITEREDKTKCHRHVCLEA
ncbi:hypothetical protein ACJX0J_040854, partial [Zea mays]